jgi:FkbM family methyltransferase
MKFASIFTRPEYVFHPSQIVRRILCEMRRSPAEYETVRLPWGSPIRIWPGESQGSCIRRLGIHDLVTNEIIWRLLDPGECAADIGANIGHMTNLMAIKVGSGGSVIAAEPHPGLFQELEYNVDSWRRMGNSPSIRILNLALTNRTGKAKLTSPPEFGTNRGISFLTNDVPSSGAGTVSYEVGATTLDELVGVDGAIALLKIDVEGHELQVLEGAAGLMSRGCIRDILFEEHHPAPTPVTRLLEANGYSIFHLDGRLLGPIAASISERYIRKIKDAPNYLATRDPQRAAARISKKGWGVYSIGPFSAGGWN